MQKLFIFILTLVPTMAFSQYQQNNEPQAMDFQWPDGKQAAISLTFDDARPSQLDNGIPILDRYDVKATFYVSPHNMENRIPDWKSAAANGHELGNHSMTHPCTGNYQFSLDNPLESYTLEAIARDIDQANKWVYEHLDIEMETFAYPCGQSFVGRGEDTKSYVPVIAERFAAGRLWLNEDANNPAFCDLSKILAIEFDGMTWADLKPWIEKSKEENLWLVLAGHDIRDSGSQTVLAETLEQVCEYASQNDSDIWVGTVRDVAKYVESQR